MSGSRSFSPPGTSVTLACATIEIGGVGDGCSIYLNMRLSYAYVKTMTTDYQLLGPWIRKVPVPLFRNTFREAAASLTLNTFVRLLPHLLFAHVQVRVSSI